jgi:hypothetical protein
VAALFATAGGGLVAWDAERLAAVEIGEDGRPGAARSYEAAFPHASVAPLGALADGSLLVSARAGRAIFQIAPGPTRDTVPLFRLGPAGAHARILSIPGPEEVTWEAAGGGAVRVSTPFAREVFAAASGDRVWVADGLRAELRGYDAAGRLRQVVRGPLRGDPVGAADAARWRERMRRLAHGRLAGEELRRLQASLVVPDSWPPFAGLLAGPGGELWARAGGAPGSPARWNVFDAAGRWRGEVRVPARFELAAAGDGYVIATEHRAEAEDRSVLVPLMR